MAVWPVAIIFSVSAFAGASSTLDAKAIAAAVCAPEPAAQLTYGAPSKLRWGCAHCPQGTGDAGRKGPFLLERTFGGSFMGSAPQSLAVFDGCETHVDEGGGSFILTRTKTGWRKGAYFKAYRPEKCLTLGDKAGRDFLACLQTHQGTGGFLAAWFSLAMFDQDGIHEDKFLSDLFSSVYGGDNESGVCRSSTPTNFSVDQKEPRKNFRIGIDYEEHPLDSPAGDSGYCVSTGDMPTTRKRYELHYSFSKGHVKLDAGSQAAARELCERRGSSCPP